MMDDTQYAVGALNEIRKDVLLLSIAKDYLCDDVFLNKFGKDIEGNILKLKEDITSMKKKFPGKFAVETDTDGIIERINGAIQGLIRPDSEIKEKCRSGEIGRKLEADLKSITEAVNIIREQVLGKRVSYTRKEAVSNIVTGIKETGSSVGNTLIRVAKILFAVIVIAVAAFLYLYFTMEKEDSLLTQIEENQAAISERQDRLAQMEQRKEEISSEIKSLEKKDMLRDEKITLMDLEVEMQQLNQDRNNLEAEITVKEKDIADVQKKIEELQKTPFIKRLLRR